jgi:hypothetical protein
LSPFPRDVWVIAKRDQTLSCCSVDHEQAEEETKNTRARKIDSLAKNRLLEKNSRCCTFFQIETIDLRTDRSQMMVAGDHN